MVNNIIFLIYCILYELIVLGGCGYSVFILGNSGWWFVLATFLSGCQLKRHDFFNEVNNKTGE